MTRIVVLFIFLFWIESNGQPLWYKGNLHTHSYWSDGDEFPEMIMDWYKTHGYQFVALSDHNILAQGERWKMIAKGKVYREGFEKYLAKYGDWVTYRVDTGRTHVRLKTLNEYRGMFEDDGFLIIQSEELTDKFGDKQVHMNATNIQRVIPPQGGNSLQEVIQRNLDAIAKQRQDTGVPIMQHLNHPNFYFSITARNIINLQGERFFEVYNGHPLVYNNGDANHNSTEQIWDEVNIAYAEQGRPLLLGLASDDSHSYHIFGPDQSNSGRGWVVVKAESLTPEALISSMEEGKFYASTGVVLNDTYAKDNVLYVDVKAEPGVKYRIEFIGAKTGSDFARVLESSKETTAQFTVTRDLLFVRAKVTSNKRRTNPVNEEEYETAWVQPVQWVGRR